ncbi:hypothetical protein PsYK624_055160 [Phanerochaete sordida]|uniref:Uncharacterized protein n=1 Tax=Phanerochaete sordida TaxID=48140 RepID=A0A9P3G8I6_9APHY|nr:hypothetical protein PsYK624_055160 [Phanerochaete sordida]
MSNWHAWRLGVLGGHAADAPFALCPSWAAYVAAFPTLPVPDLDALLAGLDLVEKAQRDTDDAERYHHWKKVFGPCRVVGRAVAGDSVLPRLEVRLDPGKRAKVRVFTAQRAHGVLLKG